MSKEKAFKSAHQSDISKDKETFQRGTLLRITQILSSSLDKQFILDNITSKVLELLDSKGATIYLIDKTKKYLHPVKSSDPYNVKEVMSSDIIINNSLSGKAVKAKKGMIFKNAALNADAYQIPGTDADEDEHLLVLPLLIQNEVLGTLNLYRRNKNYKKEDLEFGEVFALYAGMAIQNSTEHQKLKNSEALNHSINNSAADAIVSINEDGIVNTWNKTAEKMFGYSSKEMINNELLVVIPERQRKSHINGLKRLKAGGKERVIGESIIVEAKHKDGSEFPIELSLSGWEMNNKKKYYTGIIRDITERKRANAEMQKLAAVVKYSSELINLSTLDGKMTFLNESGRKMLGIEPHEIENTNIMEVIPEHLKDLVEKELIPALMKEGIWEGDLQYRNMKTSKLTDVHAMTFTIKDTDSGEPQYMANVSLDITERKRVENKLKSRNSELEVFYEATVNRELKLIELKKEINELLEDSGKKQKYKIPI